MEWSKSKSKSKSDGPLILLIEDEQDVVSAMAFKLNLEGYQTRFAMNGEDGLKEALREPIPNLVLLDVMLPGISGLDVCLQLRQDPRTEMTPVIMVTAKGAEIDRVLGLEVGADDYLVKPFSVRELMLRIQVALKRSTPREAPKEAPLKIEFGKLTVEMDSHRVFVDQTEIQLTATEFKLLTLFVESPRRVYSRDFLLDVVWGLRSIVQTRTVDSHIAQLRRKLGVAADCIETIRGVGYRFNPSVEKTNI
ncbi:MAG: response regulator [Magnetococcales bacterium]|nr:response regulator [Magnetococcales bacterium]